MDKVDRIGRKEYQERILPIFPLSFLFTSNRFISLDDNCLAAWLAFAKYRSILDVRKSLPAIFLSSSGGSRGTRKSGPNSYGKRVPRYTDLCNARNNRSISFFFCSVCRILAVATSRGSIIVSDIDRSPTLEIEPDIPMIREQNVAY